MEKNIMGKSQFNCWIPTEVFDIIKKKDWKFAYVVQEGVKFLENRTNIRTDVEEDKLNIEKLQRANQRMQEKIFELQKEIDKVIKK